MTRTVAALAVFSLGVLCFAVGCGKRVHYVNAFGEYSLSDAQNQYEELFQMKPCQYKKFLSFKHGWWIADVKIMREMGVSVPLLCERYCRMNHIKVPFPLLVDYDLLRENV